METLTQIAIWNRALGFLGARSIAAEDENTPEALQCRLYWDSARRQALRDYPWAFAQRRAWLARVALPSGFEQEYRFAYALPEACLKAHEVRHEGLLPLPFCLARDPAGDATILLTSASRALLLYTEDVRHCHQFDDLFAHMQIQQPARAFRNQQLFGPHRTTDLRQGTFNHTVCKKRPVVAAVHALQQHPLHPFLRAHDSALHGIRSHPPNPVNAL